MADVPRLLDQLLQVSDPAMIGVRRILKKKIDDADDFPLKRFVSQDLATNKSGKVFNELERRVIELEKKNSEYEQSNASHAKEIDSERKKSYAAGLAEGAMRGQKAGYEKANKEFNASLSKIEERFVAVFKNIERMHRALFVEAQQDVLAIATLFAKKIIATELKLNPEIILNIIKKTLQYVSERQKYVIRISPNDAAIVGNQKEFWSSIADRLETITIQQDERIDQGGCIIESENGIADAQISVQIQEMEKIIVDTWNSILITDPLLSMGNGGNGNNQ